MSLMPSEQALLDAYPAIIEVPIAWGDMDAFQHVNNTRYFRFFESVRIAYFEKLGLMELVTQSGIGPILAETRCQFKLPMTFPDTAVVGGRITEVETDRFHMDYAVVSRRHEKIAARGYALVVCYNYPESRKAPIPDTLKSRIHAVEGWSDVSD